MSENRLENFLYSAGVPKRYWHIPAKEYKPVTVKYDNSGKTITLNSKDQKAWLDSLMKGNFHSSYSRTIIGSAPTDEVAMKVVTEILIKMFQRNSRSKIKVVNLLEDFDIWKRMDLIVFHNIFSNSNEYRLQRLRDYIVACDDSPIIIVTGGWNPIEFFKEQLNLKMDGIIYFKDKL